MICSNALLFNYLFVLYATSCNENQKKTKSIEEIKISGHWEQIGLLMSHTAKVRCVYMCLCMHNYVNAYVTLYAVMNRSMQAWA